MDADEFRDYILGFIFYKYLSEKMHLYANQILDADGIDYIDILMTDAEGYDYRVADGASYFLDGGRVGLYIFELWGRNIPLRQHLERLARAGFRCYFPQSLEQHIYRAFVPISGVCWREEYNYVGWSNVVCANTKRAPELVRMLDAMSVRRQW